MEPFLQLLAKHIHANFTNDTESLCIILPNKRGALYLKHYLASVFNKTIWLPTILSAEEFVAQLSELQQADSVDLICDLYNAYCTVLKDKAEPFDSFVKWGNLMLQDFNEADRYLVDTKALYQNLKEIKEIENWSLAADELTQTQEDYILFMQQMGHIYNEFTEKLLAKKQGYQGLMYRKANEKFKTNNTFKAYSHILIAGFNALNKVETIIFSELVKTKKATVLWDIDKYYFDNINYEAGLFLRKNFENQWLVSKNFIADNFKTSVKQIDIVAVPNKMGQAQVVGNQISKWIAEGKSLSKIAVVLADESLLFPIINQLPKEVEHVNITMEYPLRFTPIYDLIENLIHLHHSIQKNNSSSFYYIDIFKILQNSLFVSYYNGFNSGISLQLIIQKIIDKNYVWLNQATLFELFGETFNNIKPLFEKWNNSTQGLNAITQIITYFNTTETEQLKLSATEQEYLFVFTRYFNRLNSLINTHTYLDTLVTLRSLFKQIIGTATVPFIGEPLKGLQIMGVLETRTLDFENIILLGINEGVLPSGKSINSFIPNDLKRYFDMPLYADKDAVYAYHFYRFLQKSSNVLITYNTEQSLLGTGEKSRFITQLQHELEKYNPHIIITEKMLSGDRLPASSRNDISIEKTTSNLELIVRKLTTNDTYSGLSPSALLTYKDCTLRFFFRYGAGIKETDDVEENAEANTQGTILHESLEILYTPFISKIIQEPDLKQSLSKVEKTVEAVFKKYFSQTESSFGKNFLQKKVVIEYVKKLVYNDIKLIKQSTQTNNYLSIINLEVLLQSSIIVNYQGSPTEIFVKGSADRIDKLGNTIRVIDYKSSIKTADKFQFIDFEKLFRDSNYNKMLQLFMYAWLVVKNNIAKPEDIMPCIIPFKKFEDIPRFITDSTKQKNQLIFTQDLLSEFETHLITTIENILDNTTLFTQTEDVKKCEYCSYAGICNIN